MKEGVVSKHWKPSHNFTPLYTGGDILYNPHNKYIYCICLSGISIVNTLRSELSATISIKNEDIISFAVTSNYKNLLAYTRSNLYTYWSIESP